MKMVEEVVIRNCLRKDSDLILEIRSVELGISICPIAKSTMTENYGRMHCACTKQPYFHFRS